MKRTPGALDAIWQTVKWVYRKCDGNPFETSVEHRVNDIDCLMVCKAETAEERSQRQGILRRMPEKHVEGLGFCKCEVPDTSKVKFLCERCKHMVRVVLPSRPVKDEDVAELVYPDGVTRPSMIYQGE